MISQEQDAHAILRLYHERKNVATQFENIEYNPAVVEMIFTQLTLKAAIKMWGNDAKIAADLEMKQLHWRVKWNKLSNHQKDMVLESHIFMKKKREMRS